MKKIISLCIVSVLLIQVVIWQDSIISKNESEFDAEFIQALQFAYEKWITNFNNVADYRPYDAVSRQEASKMFGQFVTSIFLKTPDLTLIDECTFHDIGEADVTLSGFIVTSCQLGLMKGWQDKYYLPANNLSKAQGIAVLVRFFNNGFMDENIDPWYTNYFNKARELWLTKEPSMEWLDRALTRYELALLLYRFYVKYELISKFGNNFDMGDAAIKIVEETVWPDGLKIWKALVDTKKFLDININAVEMNLFGIDFIIEKTKLVNQFTDAFTRFGDVYKEEEYVGVASFNIVQNILTDGIIRPLKNNDWIFYTISMSEEPPFYKIKEVKLAIQWWSVVSTWSNIWVDGIDTSTWSNFTGNNITNTIESPSIVNNSTGWLLLTWASTVITWDIN
jgi:hypothetical protein